MKVRNKKNIILVVLIFITLCFIEFLLLKLFLKENLSEDCSTTFELSSKHSNITMPASIIFILNPNGEGLINLRGSVRANDIEHVISRVIKFRYEVSDYNKSMLTLNDFDIVKYASDNIDDYFFNSEILDFSTEKNLYVILQRFHDMLIVGNPFSPVFVCMKN